MKALMILTMQSTIGALPPALLSTTTTTRIRSLAMHITKRFASLRRTRTQVTITPTMEHTLTAPPQATTTTPRMVATTTPTMAPTTTGKPWPTMMALPATTRNLNPMRH